MRRIVAGCLMVVALALGALAGMALSRAEAAVTAPLSVFHEHEPVSLVQTVQYYGYRRYYGRPRFYGHRHFYGYRRYYGGPRFYGRGPGYYGYYR